MSRCQSQNYSLHTHFQMAEHLHWVTGLMYLIDPGLSSLRTKWTAVLFSELRKIVLQALTVALPKINKAVSAQYDIIRR